MKIIFVFEFAKFLIKYLFNFLNNHYFVLLISIPTINYFIIIIAINIILLIPNKIIILRTTLIIAINFLIIFQFNLNFFNITSFIPLTVVRLNHIIKFLNFFNL